jgi:hypothetical protein
MMIVLADITSYLYVWQWAPVGVFVAAWLVGGGWLFRRELMKASGLSRRRVKFRQGLLASFTTGCAGILLGLLVGLLFYHLGRRFKLPALNYVGVAAGAMMALAAAYVAGYMILGLSARRTLTVTWRPIVAVFAMAAIVTAACAPASVSQTRAEEGKTACARNMAAIAFRLQQSFVLPKDLQALVAGNHLRDAQIHCPAGKKEYFYMPVHETALLDKMLDKTVVVCDLAGNHPGGRHVVFADWSCAWKTNDEFAELLKLPVNEAFARELQQAESK